MEPKKKPKPHWFFWVMVGPLTLFLPFLLLFFQRHFLYFPFFLFSPVGVLFSWLQGKKGSVFSTLCLVSLGVLFLFSSSIIEMCWGMGVILAMALSFFITALSSEEVEERIDSLEAESKSRLKHLVRLDEKYQKVEKKWHRKLDEETTDQQKKIAFLHDQLSQAQREVARRKEASDLERELSRVQGQYRQLREQFVEKSRMLSETRRELFLYREKKSMQEREWSEHEGKIWEEWEKAHIDVSKQWEKQSSEEKEAYEAEIEALHDLISHLSLPGR